MDIREHPDHDSTGEGADEEMQIEANLASDIIRDHEMQVPESGANFNDIGASDTQHTINVTVPAPSSTSTLSREPSSSASQRTSVRRNRVEDDHDDDRDRRHPSERLSSPSHSANITQQPNSLASTPLQTSSHTPESTAHAAQHLSTPGNSRLNPFHFFRHILPHSLFNPNDANPTPVNSSLPLPTGLSQQDRATLDPSTQTPVAAAVPPTTSNDGQWQLPLVWTPMGPHHLGGFTITIDANGNSTTTPFPISSNVSTAQGRAPPPTAGIPSIPNVQAPQGDAVPGAHRQEPSIPQQPQGIQMPRDTQAPLNYTPDGASIADIFARIGLFTALSLRDLERDVDDPERARKLVDGLEDVPIGLIRRLERVGKADLNNEHEHHREDRLETSLGDNGCTICWEQLLLEAEEPEPEPEQGNATVEGNEKTHEHGTPTDHQDLPPHTQTDAGVSSSVSESQKKKHYRRIVTLPCAHAFHADCLVPWFSKPKQTTCPICRFNIDPENLTYTKRAQGTVPHVQTHQNDDGGGTNATTGAPVNNESRTVPVADVNVDLSPREGIQDHNAEPNPRVFIYTGDPSGAVENAGVDAEQNRLSDMFTIGFEMYIEHGPPPFLLGGPNFFQAPVPGHQNNGNDAVPFPLPIPMAGAPVNATGSDTTNTMSQGSIPTGNANPSTGTANTGGPSGETVVVPPEVGPGMGLTLADIVTRIVSSNLSRRVNVTAAGGQTEQGGPTGNHIRPQGPGPISFGPDERPPAMLPDGIPEHIRSELIAGLQRARIQNIPAASLRSSDGASAQPGGTQPATNTGVGVLPTSDIAFGSFGGPTPPDQGQERRADLRASASNVQPAQPRPRQIPGQGQEAVGFLSFTTGPPSSPPPFRFHPSPLRSSRQQGPRKKWAPPSPPGLTLRQKVEKREQEVGLRCCDVSCGVGPSDEDPWVHATEHGLKQLSIRASPSPSVVERMMAADSRVDSNCGSGENENERVSNDVDTGRDLERKTVCPHMFHSSCLVSSERVSLALRDAQVRFVGPEGHEEVEVSCPVCRGSGRVSKEEWEAGMEALGEPRVAFR